MSKKTDMPNDATIKIGESNGWHAMDVAPTDGSKILVWTHRKQVEIARWDSDRYARHPQPYWRTSGPWGVREMRLYPPLAWMPLPTAPRDA